MSAQSTSELLNEVISDLTDAIGRQSWDLACALRKRLQSKWVDAIHVETRAATSEKGGDPCSK